MQIKTHAKTVHALQVFDKMPQATRHFLEGPNLPDQCRSLWVHKRVVRLVCTKHKLVSASFAKLQFWTGGKGCLCMDQNYSNGSTLLDLRVLQGGLETGKRIMGNKANKNRVAVENAKLDQRAKEDDLLKIFKEHHWVFA